MGIGGVRRAAPPAAQVRNNSQPLAKPQGLEEFQLGACCITLLKTPVQGGGAMHNVLGVTLLGGTKVRMDWKAEGASHNAFTAKRSVQGTALSALLEDHARSHASGEAQRFWSTLVRLKAGRVNQGDRFG